MFGQVTKVTCGEPKRIPPTGLIPRRMGGWKREAKRAVAGELRAIPRTMPDCSPGFDALALGVGHGVDVGAHHPDLIVFFIQVVQQNVPQRDDSDQLPLMTDWQV